MNIHSICVFGLDQHIRSQLPMPVPGWILAGVMTIGAAQILLKESEIGIQEAIFVGSGPFFIWFSGSIYRREFRLKLPSI